MRVNNDHHVWLNDSSLRDVDANIIIRKVIEKPATEDIAYMVNPGRPGRRTVSQIRRSRTIELYFSIRGLYNLAERAAVLDAVNGWARGGGVLRVYYRPEQQIKVDCVRYASPEDVIACAGLYEIDFEANTIPYWENDTPATFTAIGASGSGQLVVGGNAPTWADVKITSRTAILTSASVTFGNSTITFEDFELASGYPLSIWHDDYGILRATSAMPPYHYLPFRTRESADDFVGGPGVVNVAYTANTACDIEITARGRYL